MRETTNKEDVFDLIQKHPEGLDDDDISAMTGITPRQQVQQLCNRLASSNRTRRESVEKPGKRRKIHNFPMQGDSPESLSSREDSEAKTWRRRLSSLVAATGRAEPDLLDHALSLRIVILSTMGDTRSGGSPASAVSHKGRLMST
jgi:hypothetical protein